VALGQADDLDGMPASPAELLAARARRVKVIRQRIAAATVASFALFWGVIAWDGSMAGETATASATTATTTEQSTTTDQSQPATTDTWSGDSGSYQDDGSALSTGQS
jgi:hypothetical protein